MSVLPLLIANLDNDLFEHAMRTIKPDEKDKFIRNKSVQNLIVSTKHLSTIRLCELVKKSKPKSRLTQNWQKLDLLSGILVFKNIQCFCFMKS